MSEGGRRTTENRGRIRIAEDKPREQSGAMIASFRGLRVYQLGFELQQEVFNISKAYQREERFALTDQIRRASRSIGANIVEPWLKRRYPACFVSKLSDADGEQAETQHWIDSAAAFEYTTRTQQKSFMETWLKIRQMLRKMMSDPDEWCHRSNSPND